MTAATWLQPDSTTQNTTLWGATIDGDMAVLNRVGVLFAPSAQASPNMTVKLQAGHVFDGTTLLEVATQNTGTITAPVSNPRIDRVVIDAITGVVSVVTGTPAGSPVAPALPAGKCPVAQIALTSGTTSITNSLITDERDFTTLGTGANTPPYAISTNIGNAYSVSTSPSFSSYLASRFVMVKINSTNTGSSTLNPNTLGAKTIKDILGNNLTPGALIANSTYLFVYDGTNYILINSGLLALLYVPQTFSGAQKNSSSTLADSAGTTTIDLSLNNDFTYTLTANTTLSFTNVIAGQKGRIAITQGSGPYTVAWDSKQGWGGAAPTVSTTAAKIDALYYDVLSSTQIITSLKKGVF